jgi:hypothetical protein
LTKKRAIATDFFCPKGVRHCARDGEREREEERKSERERYRPFSQIFISTFFASDLCVWVEKGKEGDS